jgi:hypothetical protein
MASDMVIPKPGMTMTEAAISRWEAGEGDWIEERQVLKGGTEWGQTTKIFPAHLFTLHMGSLFHIAQKDII